MKRIWIIAAAVCLGCAVPPANREESAPVRKPTVSKRNGPAIRVALIRRVMSLDFSADRDFAFIHADGKVLAWGKGLEKWNVRIRSVGFDGRIYRLVAASMSSRGKALKKASEIEALGFRTSVEPTVPGGTGDESVRFYRVFLEPPFETYEAAKSRQQDIRNRLDTFVAIEERDSPGSPESDEGLFLFSNPVTGQAFTTSRPVSVRGANITVYGIPVGSGYHWERSEDITFPETVVFRTDADGTLAAINTVSLEVYLKGVVPSEMHPGFPTEALKAQAVAARSRVYANFGWAHPGDPFDVCSEVHCQVYSGLSRRTPMSDRAVDETAGLVLWSGDDACDAVFGAVCGGHGEDVQNAWVRKPMAYLRGDFDGPGLKPFGRLDSEGAVRTWIDGNPDCYCNTVRLPAPKALEYTKKYFRWEEHFEPERLRSALMQSGAPYVGAVLDLVPELRGSSGRIVRLRVLGTGGETTLVGELVIRKALSPSTLWSSCFYVERETGSDGRVSGFVLKGAGWGHGVGMCQTGAAGMALRGRRFDRILRQYYRAAHLKRMY